MIANRGHFYTPHVVKAIQDTVIDENYLTEHHPDIEKRYFEMMDEGMAKAVTGGTCRIAAFRDVVVCGKTGTAQNPHGKDHSAFMGYAPRENPKIAIAVYVENAGFGATFGVPIGSLVMEKYLHGEISPERQYLEDRMVNSNTMIWSNVKK